MSPVPLDRLRGREAAQLRQAAAGKGLTERDRAGAGRSLPLSSAAKGESECPGGSPRGLPGHGGFQKHGKQRALPGSIPCRRGHTGSNPHLCPDSHRSQARVSAAGLCLPLERVGVSIPEKSRQAACPGGELSERRCSPAAGC